MIMLSSVLLDRHSQIMLGIHILIYDIYMTLLSKNTGFMVSHYPWQVVQGVTYDINHKLSYVTIICLILLDRHSQIILSIHLLIYDICMTYTFQKHWFHGVTLPMVGSRGRSLMANCPTSVYVIMLSSILLDRHSQIMFNIHLLIYVIYMTYTLQKHWFHGVTLPMVGSRGGHL